MMVSFSGMSKSVRSALASGYVLFNTCGAGSLVNIEVDEGSGVASEYDLIGGVGFFAHLQGHDGWVVLGYGPVVSGVAVAADSFKGLVWGYCAVGGVGAA